MAQQTITKLFDDLARHEDDREIDAQETVRFGLDGKSYEIDLNSENAEELREFLGRYVEAGRPVRDASPRTRTGPTQSRDRLNRQQSQEVRAWARSRGMEVSARGRIPSEITEAYHQAHSQS